MSASMALCLSGERDCGLVDEIVAGASCYFSSGFTIVFIFFLCYVLGSHEIAIILCFAVKKKVVKVYDFSIFNVVHTNMYTYTHTKWDWPIFS